MWKAILNRGPTIGYVVVFEVSRTGFAAYVPDLPGCVTTGRSMLQTKRRIREAVALHIAALKRSGQPIPRARTITELRRRNRL